MEFAQELPRRLNRVLDALANQELALQVDAVDEHRLLAGFHRIANRALLGLISATFLVSGSLLMQAPLPHRLAGYPLLGLLFILAGLAFGTVLLVAMIRSNPPADMGD